MGTFVQYGIGADPTIPEAKILLAALKRMFRSRQDAAEYLIRHFTAFTHPRRIAIVAVLGRREMPVSELRARTEMSRQAMGRHLEKLMARGYVARKGDSVCCVRPRNEIQRTLLELAQSK
jgi:DNA-binding transcriptional ArsR family regulator